MGREWEGLREVQEGRHSNGSQCCSEAELPLGKEIKCFLSISVGKVISDKLLQPRQGWRGLAGGSLRAATCPCARGTQGDHQDWGQIGN